MTQVKLDYKKEFKDLYLPKNEPMVVDVPEMNFIMVDGKGNPNDEEGEYKSAVEILYALSYAIKMSKKGSYNIEGYFEYVVPPLEGLWWVENDEMDFTKKDKFEWTSMIRQPEFVTKEVFEWACSEVLRKKPDLNVSKARLQSFREGLCVQIMHIGSYDDEPKTVEKLDKYVEDNNLINAISTINEQGIIKRHHEIYLSDPRKTSLDKLKTVIRHPVKNS
ncbi:MULTISPECIES: GyrI-like domain-containing protein [Clostridium]|uniref:GyrI-like domain-containing protein n=1 Tax=Clostridium TaxID=1485 RepID=UPI002580637F|nr:MULTISPECIES: GyrI-like domain-containing protein [Clostridium]WRY52349.1 GyrI-like domain-containing protein [Clostridium intestinale]